MNTLIKMLESMEQTLAKLSQEVAALKDQWQQMAQDAELHAVSYDPDAYTKKDNIVCACCTEMFCKTCPHGSYTGPDL